MEDAVHPAGRLVEDRALPAAERCTNVFVSDGLSMYDYLSLGVK